MERERVKGGHECSGSEKGRAASPSVVLAEMERAQARGHGAAARAV